MKKFETPRMNVLTIEREDVMRTSSCFERFACEECYCTAVQCGGTYDCTGLVCSTLSDYD